MPLIPSLWLIAHVDGDVVDIGYGDYDEAHQVAVDLGPGHVVLPDYSIEDEPNSDAPVMALGKWKSNAEMIVDVAKVGYLNKDMVVCDPTFGLGVFWKKWRPRTLIASDLEPRKSPAGHGIDATNLPMEANSVDAIMIDGPYKLNGRADVPVDSRYGVDEWSPAPMRIELIYRMMTEGARVLRPYSENPDGTIRSGIMLVKCQPQVNSARKWWQDQLFSAWGAGLGLRLVDQFVFESYRPQPARSTCIHCRSKIMRRENGMWGDLARKASVTYTCVKPPVGSQTEGQMTQHEPGPLEQDHAASNYSVLLVLQAPAAGTQETLL